MRTTDEIIKTISENLRVARQIANLKQSEVSKLTGIKKNRLSLFENAGSIPSSVELARLADVYGVTSSYLLGDEDRSQSGVTAAVSKTVGGMNQKEAELVLNFAKVISGTVQSKPQGGWAESSSLKNITQCRFSINNYNNLPSASNFPQQLLPVVFTCARLAEYTLDSMSMHDGTLRINNASGTLDYVARVGNTQVMIEKLAVPSKIVNDEGLLVKATKTMARLLGLKKVAYKRKDTQTSRTMLENLGFIKKENELFECQIK